MLFANSSNLLHLLDALPLSFFTNPNDVSHKGKVLVTAPAVVFFVIIIVKKNTQKGKG